MRGRIPRLLRVWLRRTTVVESPKVSSSLLIMAWHEIGYERSMRRGTSTELHENRSHARVSARSGPYFRSNDRNFAPPCPLGDIIRETAPSEVAGKRPVRGDRA